MSRSFGWALVLLGGGTLPVLLAAGMGGTPGGEVQAVPIAGDDGGGTGSGPRPRAAEEGERTARDPYGPDDTYGGVVITHVEKVPVKCKDTCGYDFELQWVVVQNRSDEIVNLEGWNLTTDNGVPLAPNGLELVEAPADLGYKLYPGKHAIIVTSPVVPMDRGAPISYRWVFQAINPDFEHYVQENDIQQVTLHDAGEGPSAVVDVDNPECLGGCCCEGHDPPNCWTDFWDGACKSSCNGGVLGCGLQSPCACWRPGDCGPPAATCCSTLGGGCILHE